MAYSTEADLLEIRPQIADLPEVNWEEQITEADKKINEMLDVHWYRKAADDRKLNWRATSFDATYVEVDDRLKRASCYGALAGGFAFAMTQPDPERDTLAEWRKFYADEFVQEIQEILRAGVSYDWDKSGVVEGAEIAVQVVPQLVRG